MKINKFDRNDILNKKFTISNKGYNSEEVDKFLDLLAEDIENLLAFIHEQQKVLNQTGELVERLNHSIRELSMKNDILRSRYENAEKIGINNSDLLDRINRLESQLHNNNR